MRSARQGPAGGGVSGVRLAGLAAACFLAPPAAAVAAASLAHTPESRALAGALAFVATLLAGGLAGALVRRRRDK